MVLTAPVTILLPKRSPIHTFAEYHLVRCGALLQRSRDGNSIIVNGFASRIRLAGDQRIVRWCNPVFEQSVQFIDLPLRHTDRILHDTPIVCVVVRDDIQKFPKARRNRLRTTVSKVILRLDPDHGKVVEPRVHMLVIHQATMPLTRFFLRVLRLNEGLPVKVIMTSKIMLRMQNSSFMFVAFVAVHIIVQDNIVRRYCLFGRLNIDPLLASQVASSAGLRRVRTCGVAESTLVIIAPWILFHNAWDVALLACCKCKGVLRKSLPGSSWCYKLQRICFGASSSTHTSLETKVIQLSCVAMVIVHHNEMDRHLP